MQGGAWLLLRLLRGSLWDRGAVHVPLTLNRVAVMAVFLPLFLATQLAHWIGFLLDEVLFRDYRRIAVREPVFIIGVPRSGTTFLHRVLTQDSERFTTFRLWELLLAPSISERVFWKALGRLDRCVGRPGERLLATCERSLFGRLDAIHRVTLDSPEEDYFALLPVFACFLLVVPFPSSRMLWQLARFDDAVPDGQKRRIAGFYRACLQRHLYVHGESRRILSKNPSFTSWIRTLGEEFPDCKIVCNVRNPLEAIPSLLSSMRSGTRLFYGGANADALDRSFLDMLDYYYRHALSELSGWSEDRHAFVTLDELQADVHAATRRIYRRFGYDVSPSFEKRLEAQSREGKRYKSRHRYSLEDFGIPPGTIVEGYSHVFERFGFLAAVEGSCPTGT